MHPLNMTKVAVGCVSAEILRDRLAARAANGESSVFTRYRPRRADELVGGSLYWIIKHRLVVRSPIIGFAEAEDGGRCIIRVDARVIPVRARPRRAHQGWRYLAGGDAPADFDGDEDGLAALPTRIAEELSALALI